MLLQSFFRYLTIDPVNLSKKEKGIAALSGFIAIFLTSFLTRASLIDPSPILVASMGASAAILFAIPNSPLAQPWPFAGGQIFSALVGVFCAAYIDDVVLAAGTAAAGAILVMLALRCLHPPGAATALAPVLSSDRLSHLPDLDFVLAPVSINVFFMLLLAYVINGLVLKRNYPARVTVSTKTDTPRQTDETLVSISSSDVEQVTRNLDYFLDISNDELLKLFTHLQLLSFQKQIGGLTCGDIMQRDIVTVEYATKVEDAWTLIHDQQIKALPVLDQTGRVIGIVTRYDFLKYLQMTPYRSFQEKWLIFIKSTTGIKTDKPEAVGHIMTRKIKTLSTNTHIAELVPLIVDEGHHHIPVTDEKGRFVGMVFQRRLLSAVFNHVTSTQVTSQQKLG